MVDALQLLRDDHKRVKELFDRFEAQEDTRGKGEIVKQALRELEIHAEIEEQIFYPAVREEADGEDDLMDEAEEEHHVVKLLIAELKRMKPGAERFDAKFTVLAENVKHHIGEEESEMLPKAAELGMARMNELGAEMERRKAKLETSSGHSTRPRVRSGRRLSGATKSAAKAGGAKSIAKKISGTRSTPRRSTSPARKRAAPASAAARSKSQPPRARVRAATPAKRRTAKRAT